MGGGGGGTQNDERGITERWQVIAFARTLHKGGEVR